MNKRLTAAEAAQIKAVQGRICRGCRVIFTPDEIPSSFAVDERTRDGLSKLCLHCIERRDIVTTARVRDSRASSQSHYRSMMRDIRYAAIRERLTQALPGHLIPGCALPDYPTPELAAGRSDREAAILTQLYGRLIDSGATRWEALADESRASICANIYRVGPGMLERIDAHLAAFGLEPLKP
jgi:hypothetical protein